jgi:2-keto-4-pentenoate hydratase/2-oxohepta-3-ene-1,7-dioic acid hydratase in catechol pathway
LNIAGVSTLASVNSGAIVLSGTITGTDVIASSDVRTKNNIITIDSALDKVMRMRGVFFERNVEPGEKRVGVIAQEVEKILPEVVYTDENGLKSVSYGSIIGLLIEAIKEQQEVIRTLI